MLQAAETYMRPLLMVSMSACVGLLPAALSHGIGSQVQKPLATVIVGNREVVARAARKAAKRSVVEAKEAATSVKEAAAPKIESMATRATDAIEHLTTHDS